MPQKLKGRKCYDHLGGKVGALLFDRLVELDWFKREEGKVTVYEITEKGFRELQKLGVKME